MLLIFSVHFVLHFLKPVSGQMVTNYEERRKYYIWETLSESSSYCENRKSFSAL